MATVELKAAPREAGNKGHARRLRMSGRIPAVVYGSGGEATALSLEGPSFELLLRDLSSAQILDLEVEGGASSKVLIKEVQRNPLTQKVLHVDLQRIDMSHKIRVHVPIHLDGSPIGVKEGGVLEHLLRELVIDCLPVEIPTDIKIDVSELARGNSVHVRDLNLPHLQIHDSPDAVIVAVVGKAKEAEVAPGEEAAAGAAPAPEAPKEG